MKVFVELNDKRYNAVFEGAVSCDKKDYGNGCYLTITRNGNEFAYLDCRYYKNFDADKVFTDYLKNYFGKNLVSIKNLATVSEGQYDESICR